MRKLIELLGLVLGAIVVTTSALAQSQAQMDQEVNRISQVLPRVFDEVIVPAISSENSQFGNVVSEFSIDIPEGACTISPEVSDSADPRIIIPRSYIVAQAVAVQAPFLYLAGAISESQLQAIITAQHEVFSNFRIDMEGSCEKLLESGEFLDVVVAAAPRAIGMPASEYYSLMWELNADPRSRFIGDVFGASIIFMLLHESAHILMNRGLLETQLDGINAEEHLADRFAINLLNQNQISVPAYASALWLLTIFEEYRELCRLSDALELGAIPMASTISGYNSIDRDLQAQLLPRMKKVHELYKNLYVDENC